MANFKSTQFTNSSATPPVKSQTNEFAGRDRIAYFTYAVPASNGPVATDTITLATIPVNARVRSIVIIVPASFVTSSCTIGYPTTTNQVASAAKYTTALDLSSVGRKEAIITTAALDYLTLDPTDVTMTITTGTPGPSLTMSGFISYIVD